MFNLWFNLEFNGGGSKSKFKKILKFLTTYILPTIVMIVFPNIIGIDIKYNIKYTLINLIIINLLYSSIIHVYIQKNIFPNFKKDVIIKFIPDRINDYIILRVYMIFMKAYLPIITSSILIFKGVVSNLDLIFYIMSLLIIVSIICINVIIAIFYKYFFNTLKEIHLKIGNFFVFIYISSVFLFGSGFTPIWYLENRFHNINSAGIITSEIEIKNLEILIIILILTLSLMLSKFTKDFLKLKGRVLILERVLSINVNKNKIRNKIQSFYEKIYSINLSNIERRIFSKDIKLVIRENKYSLLFIILLQVINIGTVIYFYFADNTKTIEIFIVICKVSTGLVITQILGSSFVAKTTLEKNVNIENDFEVLKNYNIKLKKRSIIKGKTRLLSAIVFPKIISVFSILILSSLIINLSSYLALIYLFAMIQLIFIKETMELWQVKSINKLNNNSTIIETVNIFAVFGAIMAFISVFKIAESGAYIKGQLVLIAITAIIYMYNLLINNRKDKYGGE